MLTEPIENLLNRNLGRSPAARDLCASLQGEALGVQLTGVEQRLVLQSLGSSLQLLPSASLEAAVDITGSPINLSLMLMTDPQSVTAKRLLTSGAVTVAGNADVLQRYRNMLILLQPDLPAELESLLGDTTVARTTAFQFSELLKSTLGFGRHVARTAVLNTAEFLAHETGDLVPRAEAEQFLSDVDLLREHTDRLTARLDHLVGRVAPNEGSTT